MRLNLGFFLFFLLSSSLFSQERELARLYLENAFEFIELENWEKAESLLDDAIDFFSEASDSFVLRAMMFYRQNRRHDALTELEQAYEFGDWLLPETREISDSLYLEMTFITGQYQRFLDFLPQTSPFLQNSKDILTRKIWIEYCEGNREKAREQALSVIKRFPEEPYLMIITFTSLFEKEDIKLDLSLFPEKKLLEEIVLNQWISEERNFSEWVKDYLMLFPEGSYADFLISLSNKDRLDKESLRVFVSDNFDRYQFVRDLVEGFEKDYTDAINSYETISFKRDTNGDLFDDEWFQLENGKLKEKIIDHNQDGIIDLHLLLGRNEMPVFAENNYFSVEFSEYPALSSVLLKDGIYQRRFSLDNFLLKAGIEELMLWTRNGIPFFDLFDASLSIEEVNSANENIISHTILENGIPVSYSEDSDGNGFIDHQLIFSNYRIIAGRRDLDEDSHYELYEYYEAGFFRGFALDSDEDRKADYWKQYSPLTLEFWDYNRDFFIDRRSRVLNDSVKLELGVPSRLKLSAEEILQWDMSNRTDWFIR